MQNQQPKLGGNFNNNNISIIHSQNQKVVGRTPEPHARHPDALKVKASQDLAKYEENLLYNKTNTDILNYSAGHP